MPVKSPNAIVPFDFDGVHVRAVIDDNGDPWFNAKDVCDALGYLNHNKAMADHCKGVTKRYPLQTPGGKQIAAFIQERDLYRLVMRSRLPAAEAFEEWVVGTVLPSIRKNGQYQAAWYSKRHAIASSSKVLCGMLEEVRSAIGKATKNYHYMNEHKLINSLLTGEYKGMDREQMSLYQMDFMAHFEIRNAILMGLGLDYQQRKEALNAESKEWKQKHKPGIEPDYGTALLPV